MKRIEFDTVEDFVSTVVLFAKGTRQEHRFISVANRADGELKASFWIPSQDLFLVYLNAGVLGNQSPDFTFGTCLEYSFGSTRDFVDFMKAVGHFFKEEEKLLCFGEGVREDKVTVVPYLRSKDKLLETLKARPVKLPAGYTLTTFSCEPLQQEIDKHKVPKGDASYTLVFDYAKAMEALAGEVYRIATETGAILLKGGMASSVW